MKKIKNFNFLYLSVSILLLLIILFTILNFFDVLGSKTTNILIYISFFITLILNSFKISLKSKSKGIITGLKIASITSLIIIILKIIFNSEFKLINLIYLILIYLLVIIASILGANKKSSNS